jgi:hypothetical protein
MLQYAMTVGMVDFGMEQLALRSIVQQPSILTLGLILVEIAMLIVSHVVEEQA